tara:strand:+ start:713 stop:829 length:117 start_codon:yes stop_codon:yes gene_type:complete
MFGLFADEDNLETDDSLDNLDDTDDAIDWDEKSLDDNV